MSSPPVSSAPVRRRDLIALGTGGWLTGPARGGDEVIAPIAAYERSSGGHLGLYAEDLATGRQLTWRADERFVMCSTFKASLAACVLARVDRGFDRLDRVVRYGPGDIGSAYAPVARDHLSTGDGLTSDGLTSEMSVEAMCAAAVEHSDNACANLLLARIGGPAALTDFWRRSLDDRVTRLDDPEPLLNRTPPGGMRNTTTPRAMACSLRQLMLGTVLSSPSRAALTGWLIGCRTGDRRLRAGLPKCWRIGNKTGNNGKDAAGDIAVGWPTAARPFVVSVYTRGGRPTPAQLDAVFAGVGRVVGERFAALPPASAEGKTSSSSTPFPPLHLLAENLR